ncbi:CRTAC1 family protein [Dactylosporangium sp. NPDC049742]|uniref:CRTAC1 family protein n=1 Tax=Dactylosporangium sp. NPDC049742 TaxID=3154737 RepID=UPI00343D8D6A
MPPQPVGVLRRLIPGAFVLVLVAALYVAAQLPEASAATRNAIANRYAFTELQIALPPGLPQHTVRQVNPKYEHIRAWISSVGAAVAVNDIDGNGRSNDLCLVDTRSDSAIVTPAPQGGATYAPFVLNPAPLPTSATMAPMGCVPGDYNADGWTDLLVYYWGRTPVLYMHKPGATTLEMAAFRPTELVAASNTAAGGYGGPLWNTNAVNVADFDGDGHVDIGVFNYFPDTQVLDPQGDPNVQMNHSMSRAENAGGAHVLHWEAASSGDEPSVTYVEQKAIPPSAATGWTLGAGSADLDGDLRPELYLANDFGRDRFFRNVSTPGQIKFALVEGERGAFTPKSLVVGHDSFKGMSIEFSDLSGDGQFDMFISNITTSWGLEESNLYYQNTAANPAKAATALKDGRAPFENKAASANIAWVGWGWDAKAADFDNSGRLSLVQTTGFVKGQINRWSWLQELAMTNDLLLQEPQMWPNAKPGDDIAGSQPFAFWAKEPNGRYVNVAKELGMTSDIPSRGVAVADVDGDGAQDFAIARQWGAPSYYRNTKAGSGEYLSLNLYRPATGGVSATGGLPGAPAYGAQVRVTTADGRTQVSQLDGGGGHSGKRGFQQHFGLGANQGKPVSAEVCWLDNTGAMHMQTLQLSPGQHTLMLTTQAQEVQPS